MNNPTFNDAKTSKRLMLIIEKIANVEITNYDYSLFQYGFPAELVVYILQRASQEFGFELNNKFVNSLQKYSFNCLVSAIEKYASN